MISCGLERVGLVGVRTYVFKEEYCAFCWLSVVKTWILSKYCHKHPQYLMFTQTRSVGAIFMYEERRTDMMKLIGPICNYANTPRIELHIPGERCLPMRKCCTDTCRARTG